MIKDDETKQKIIKLLANYIIYQEHPHKTFTDKLTEWLTKLMPTEKDFTEEAKPSVSEKAPEKSL